VTQKTDHNDGHFPPATGPASLSQLAHLVDNHWTGVADKINALTSIIEQATQERERMIVRARSLDKPMSWTRIGQLLGVSKQTAHERYGAPRGPVPEKITEPLFDV